MCFSGKIAPHLDILLAKDISDEGLFVVRSEGGDAASAVALSNLIRDWRVTVVVYGFCLSASAYQ